MTRPPPDTFTIRPATPADAPLLPAVEQSAGQAFLQTQDLAWVADDSGQSVERHLALISQSVAWVAVGPAGPAALEEAAPVGFLNGEVLQGNLHIWEMSVHKDHQGKGIGRALMAQAKKWAAEQQLPSVTLTTFRHVPWNEQVLRVNGVCHTRGRRSDGCPEASLGRRG
ncbi:GCN5- N-acetyltransferase [Metarhizium album ARSEF 1941]|uniref:GCN5-N-acetyltransferase n=1 Tax=Metarhizium album (strain ARSEF 1941) TaxID=1081103 RepID=A0A0B2X1H3_METAS|nr:GCN5- N-acetyltransferase [Metarhizium album ARSEF 1941]KHN98940.1 GCN5- N-acetyltransferase [Metarhizium album ARSEF 1941]